MAASRAHTRKGPEQLPLDLGHGVARTREDLIISDPLTAAISIIDRWPDWASPIIVLCGPRGAGKTHLATIWQQRSDAVTLRAEALDIAAAADRHVLVEDVDRQPLDETRLFHLLNTVRQHGTTMLMTGRLWPAAWPVTLPDLRSRLKAATVAEIGEPDDDLLSQVIVKLFSDRQIVVEPRVVAYLVARMERSFDAASAVVAEIDRLALARRQKITTQLAAEALALRNEA
ncbi:DnaA regulatory inactivator HdaA [Pararhizobium haloflavum]|uniref:DnaA regulatory inactivator HdaA n=1 Tax=Pararhizobium haloflavum TaxID=2037914 RepID=UPI000C19602E|nr:DnaA regulatory inactivator HdaA [Pararhizobium haloflavum]